MARTHNKISAEHSPTNRAYSEYEPVDVAYEVFGCIRAFGRGMLRGTVLCDSVDVQVRLRWADDPDASIVEFQVVNDDQGNPIEDIDVVAGEVFELSALKKYISHNAYILEVQAPTTVGGGSDLVKTSLSAE